MGSRTKSRRFLRAVAEILSTWTAFGNVEVAPHERRLWVDALLQARAAQPRERQRPPDGLGPRARRDAGPWAERPRERGEPAHRQRVHVHDGRMGERLQDRCDASRSGKV